MEKTPKDPKDPQTQPEAKSGASNRRRKTSQAQVTAPAQSPKPVAKQAETTAAKTEAPTKPDAKPETNKVEAAKAAEQKSTAAKKTEPAKPSAEKPKSAEATKPKGAATKPPQKPAPKPEQPEQKQPSNAAIYVAVVALLFAMGSLAFTAWQWQQDQKLKEEKSVATAVLNNQMTELKQSLAQQQTSLERRVERGEAGVDKARESVLLMQQQLAAAESRAAQRQPKDWLLAEANYLVRMASRKLWLEQDPDTALALLKDADSRLQSMGETELLPIRGKLADDIAMVAALPRTDLAGLSLKIESMIGRIDGLPLNTVQLPDPSELQAKAEVSGSIEDWRANLMKSWHALTDDFVTVRRRQGEVQPLLSPEQEWFLRELMKGKLMQGQLAMYHGHDDGFQKAVRTAHTWMTEYFKRDDSAVEAALAELDDLAKTDLAQTLPVRFSVTADLEGLASQRLSRGVE